MHEILNALQNLPSGTVEVVLGGIIASVVLQPLKGWLKLQSDKVITALLSVVSFIAVAIDYLINTASQNPTILGQRTAMVVGAATLAYRFFTKPVYNVLSDAKTLRAKQAGLAGEATNATPAAEPVPASALAPAASPEFEA